MAAVPPAPGAPGRDSGGDGATREGAAPTPALLNAAEKLARQVPTWLWGLIALLGTAVLVLMQRSLHNAHRRSDERHAACLATVRTLAASVEARDPCTGGHLERVSKLGMLVGRAVAPRQARNPQMEFGFMLHDVGKLAVPDSVLHKPGRLDAEEREIMRRHPEEGARILSQVPDLEQARDVVLHHHERWDGGGYPARLVGEEIPLWARIFAVVDALDAMTSERPYGRRFTLDEALDEIAAGSGTQFDPHVVLTLLQLDRSAVEVLLEQPAQRLPAGRPARLALTRARA